MISAADRNSVYSLLKAKGIRPSFVKEAPGVINVIWGRGKRWSLIVVLVALLIVLVHKYIHQRSEQISVDDKAGSYEFQIEGTERRQVIGDVAIIERGMRTGWADVFDADGERFLACFAVPGRVVAVRSIDTEEFEKAIYRKCEMRDDDSLEVRQIKSMVEGMKKEARDFISAGGSAKQYGRLLVERQEEEIRCYAVSEGVLQRAIREGVTGEDLLNLWEKQNDELRRMGISPIPMPREIDGQIK